MEWRAPAILLSTRRHGESASIIEVFAEDHGRQAGVVRGGGGRRLAPVLQPGATLDVTWRARLEVHLGNFTVEPMTARAGAVLQDRAALAGIAATTALCGFCLPERQACPALYRQTETVLDMIVAGAEGDSLLWAFAYLRWEEALLSETGFGLDLQACAVTGDTEGTFYVSPRTGRAVSAPAAGVWADRMLPLPDCLRGAPPGTLAEVVTGLRTTGFFLEEHLAPALGDKPLPAARARLVTALQRLAARDGDI